MQITFLCYHFLLITFAGCKTRKEPVWFLPEPSGSTASNTTPLAWGLTEEERERERGGGVGGKGNRNYPYRPAFYYNYNYDTCTA